MFSEFDVRDFADILVMSQRPFRPYNESESWPKFSLALEYDIAIGQNTGDCGAIHRRIDCSNDFTEFGNR